MVRVDASIIAEESEALKAFLQGKLGSTLKAEGKIFTIEEGKRASSVNAVTLKTYMKRFLHQQGLKKDYRVLVIKGDVKIVKRKLKEEKKVEA